MKRSAIAAVGLSLGVLAGCGQTSEPSPPPTSEAALSTPSDDSEVTSEAPTTEAVTEEPEADGPPEMPEEAMEQTEAGAEAFALHYIDLINYTGMYPETGLLEPLAADGCESCANYESNVESLLEQDAANDGPAAEIIQSDSTATGEYFVVLVDLEQNAYDVKTANGEVINEYSRISGVQFKFEIAPDDPWKIKEIQVSTGR